MPYISYELTDESREKLLKRFNPIFPDVSAHHVTLMFGNYVEEDILKVAKYYDELIPVRVVGYAYGDDGIEAVVVSINDTTTRPDGKTFHITISYNELNGKVPKDANTLVAAGWSKLDEPFILFSTLKYNKY